VNQFIGATVRDRITGFQGVVTGRVEYITGCNQLLVTPKVRADGKLDEPHWFDEQRVVQIGDSVIRLDNSATPGADKPAPIR
jgi:hypothetical protein